MRTLMAIAAAALVAAVVVLVWMSNRGTPSRQAQGPELGKVFVYDASDERIGVLDYKSSAPTVRKPNMAV